MMESASIWSTNFIRIVGPTSDLPGITHGVLYWYLISPVSFLTSGNVYAVKLLLVGLSLLNIILCYFLAQKLFKNKHVSLLSAFLMAISFESIQYARWISNPSLAVFSTALTYYGIWLILTKKGVGLPVSLTGFALSLHFEFFLVYLSGFILFSLIYIFVRNGTRFRNIFTAKYLILSLFSVVLLLPFIAKEVKFGFPTTIALLSFFGKSGGTASSRIAGLIPRFFDKLSFNVMNNFSGFSFSVSQALLIFITAYTLYMAWNNRKTAPERLFLLFWFYSPFFLYLFERSNAYFLTVGNSYPLIILTALVVYEIIIYLKKEKKVLSFSFLLIFIIYAVLGNFSLITKNNIKGEVLFATQEENLYKDEVEIVDWTYKMSKGAAFRINTITNPLFINTTWSFLYSTVGKPKYGYMPEWGGYPQAGEGVFGANIKYGKYDDQTKLLFLIIEPSSIIPANYLYAYQKFENDRSVILEEKKFGKHIVQMRKINVLKYFNRDDIFNYSLEYK